MSKSDSAVLSLGDAVVRESDLSLLSGPHWLNDRLIGFYFEYLHAEKFDNSSRVCFVSPEVSQFLKLVYSHEELALFLEPLELENKDVVVLAVNNASDPDRPGGSHWSLLVYTGQARQFFHLDSSSGLNSSDAALIVGRLSDFLGKKIGQKVDRQVIEVPVLQQTNGYDCGIHLLVNAAHATRHFLVYGSSQGLLPVDPSVAKAMRSDLLKLIVDLSGCKAADR